MKKYVILFFIICLILSSCSLVASETIQSSLSVGLATESSEMPSDSFVAKNAFAFGENTNFLETDKYYFWIPISQEYLMYYEKETGVSGYVCGKPECSHNGQECNAYLGWIDMGSLAVYDNQLYWIGAEPGQRRDESYGIYKMNFDGTGRTRLRLLMYEKLVQYQYQNAYLCGETYYCQGWADVIKQDSIGNNITIGQRVTLSAIPLYGGEETLVFDKHFNPGCLVKMIFNDQSAYICITESAEINTIEHQTSNRTENDRWNLYIYYLNCQNQSVTALAESTKLDVFYRCFGYNHINGFLVAPIRLRDLPDGKGDSTVYKITDGSIVPFVDIGQDKDKYISIRISEDGVVLFSINNNPSDNENDVQIAVKMLDFEKTTIFEGILPMDYRKHIDAEHRFAGINALWMNGKELFIQAVEIIDGKRVDYLIQYKMDVGNADEKVLFYE